MCCLISILYILENEVIHIAYAYIVKNVVFIELCVAHFLWFYLKDIIFYYIYFLLSSKMFNFFKISSLNLMDSYDYNLINFLYNEQHILSYTLEKYFNYVN